MASEKAIRYRQLTDQLIATFTPEQRQLLRINPRANINPTAHQVGIMKAMDAVDYIPKNMTFEEAYKFGLQDTINEDYERGWKAADKALRPFEIMAWCIGILIVLSFLLSHC